MIELYQHILVIINPVSGKRNGCEIFYKHSAPLLQKSEIDFVVEITKYSGHAYDIAKNYDLTGITGIISVGGDTHLHQIVNGLYDRSDDVISKITIGCIAAGSGNGVAKSLGLLDPIVSTKSIINNQTTKINYIDMLEQKTSGVGLLSLTCGFIADFDILMEKKFRFVPLFFRWLLNQIFIPIYLILMNRRYNVTISILPEKQMKANSLWKPHNDPQKAEGGWLNFQGEITTLALCNLPYITEDVLLAPSVLNTNTLDLVILNPISRMKLVKFFLQAEKGKHATSPDVQYISVKQFELLPHNNYTVMYDGEEIKYENTNSIKCSRSSHSLNFFSPRNN